MGTPKWHELAVQRSITVTNVFKDSFLDIEISALPFLNKWEKQEAMYTPQQLGLHKIKKNTEKGESSKAASRKTIMLDGDDKGKATTSILQDEWTDAQDPTTDIDEEYNRLMERHYQKILDEYEPAHDSSDQDNDYDSDRSPMGPW